MRSDRRHELRQNELSAQIDRVTESVKQNATLLTTIIVGAIVIVGGAVWFVNQRASAQGDAWSRLQPSAENTDPTVLLAQYEAVARDNVTPEITRSAYLMVGETALTELRKGRKQGDAPNPERNAEMRDKAKAAYEKVVADPGKDVTALGQALMGLGVLAEDAGDFDKAREIYGRVIAHTGLKDTPFAKEAAYRTAHMNEWSAMIEFPEPLLPPMAKAPEGSTEAPAGTFVPPVDLSEIPNMGETGGDVADTDAATSDAGHSADDTTNAEEGAEESNPAEAPPTDAATTDAPAAGAAEEPSPGE